MSAVAGGSVAMFVYAVAWLLARRRARNYDLAMIAPHPVGILAALAGGAAAGALVPGARGAAFAILAAGLAVCAETDLRFHYVFDPVVAFLALATAGCEVAAGAARDAVAGAAAIGGPFLMLALLTRWRGFGWGDVTLAIPIGIVLGPRDALLAAAAAFIGGALAGCALIASRRLGRRDPLPFAPFLTLGVVADVVAAGRF